MGRAEQRRRAYCYCASGALAAPLLPAGCDGNNGGRSAGLFSSGGIGTIEGVLGAVAFDAGCSLPEGTEGDGCTGCISWKNEEGPGVPSSTFDAGVAGRADVEEALDVAGVEVELEAPWAAD